MGAGASAEEESGPWAELDTYTRKLIQSLVPGLLNFVPLSAADVHDPEDEGEHDHDTKTISMGSAKFTFEVGPISLKSWAKFEVLTSDFFFPVDDKTNLDFSDEEMQQVLQLTGLDKAMPKGNHAWADGEMQSDDAVARIAFFGIAAHLLEACGPGEPRPAPSNAAFKVDLRGMEALEVREGFSKYGGCAYFDADACLVGIALAGELLSAGDAAWEHAKFVWRVSVVTRVTVVDHLFSTHFSSSNMMNNAAAQYLPCEHPLRRALHPFLFRTSTVNDRAGRILLPENSIVHHASALTYDALVHVAQTAYMAGGEEWRPVPDAIAAKGAAVGALADRGLLPFAQDAPPLYAALRVFFAKVLPEDDAALRADEAVCAWWSALSRMCASPVYVPAKLGRDAVLDTLAQFAFSVTGFHEHAGSIAEYTLDPARSGLRARPGSVRIDGQSWLQSAALTGLTAMRMPALLEKFESYWTRPGEAERWASLHADLERLEGEIAERNKTRRHAVVSFMPSRLELSVSV